MLKGRLAPAPSVHTNKNQSKG